MTKLQDFLNSPVSQVTRMGRAPKQGDVYGLELECEGRNVDWDGGDEKLLRDWAPHNDGSLRAHHGSCCEWVFNGPVKYEKCVDRVDALFDYFKKRQAKLVCSNRTSFHVHFNMGDKNAYQLINLFILFTILEDILDSYCGDDRKGNLFCLSSRHAEEQVRWVQDACFKHFSFGNFAENQRYCSLNMAAVNKFGTVEFRAMRGLDNKQDVLNWVSIIKEFCEYACYTVKNPVNLIEEISMKTPKGFLRQVFSPANYALLTQNLSDDLINGSIYEGLRLVQMLVYRIGTEFDQVRLRGRDFWASFAGDAEPDRDVDPAQFVAQGRFAPAPRGARGLRGAPARAAIPVDVEPFPEGWGQEPANLGQILEGARAQMAQAIRPDARWINAMEMIGNPPPQRAMKAKAVKVRPAMGEPFPEDQEF